MKVRVLQDFMDKHTLIIHKKDDVIDMTDERCAEVNSTSLGSFVVKEIETESKDVVEDNSTEKPPRRKIKKEGE